MILAVTGTSTGVGKTIACAAIAAAAGAAGRRVTVVKPAQTGFAAGAVRDADGGRSDTDTVAALVPGVTAVEGRRFPDPLAPLTAARRAGAAPLGRAEAAELVRGFDAPDELVLIEGAGGILVRLGVDGAGAPFTLLDLARDLGAPVAVVTDPALGTLNHTELTTRALAAAGVGCAGLILGRWPARPTLAESCNRVQLPELTGVRVVGAVADGAPDLTPPEFAAAAPRWFDPDWPHLNTSQFP